VAAQKILVGILLACGTTACRGTLPVPAAEATEPPVVLPETSATSESTVEPFEVVLMARGGRSTNPVYDFTVRSDGCTALQLLKYKQGAVNRFEGRAPQLAIQSLTVVLASSALRSEEGA